MQGDTDNNWKELGNDVKNAVQDAISRGDYSELSSDITRLTNQALGNIGNMVSGYAANQAKPLEREAETRTPTPRNVQSQQMKPRSGTVQAGIPNRILYESVGIPKALSAVEAAIGFVVGGCLAISELVVLLVSSAFINVQGGARAAGLIMLPIMLIGFAAGIDGVRRFSLAQRFKQYTSLLKNNTYINISELAQHTNRRTSKVKTDIRRMLRKGWFRQGHIDRCETCLITSNEMYQTYLQTQKNQEEAALLRARDDENVAKLSDEEREMLEAGEEYIREIHVCNDEIPGEVMSAKIEKLENSVHDIVERAKEHPEMMGSLRKMMSYYLPTTVKLLKAYAEMDKQEIAGENIKTAKCEIEDTIDTMNDSFEKLFDSLFQNISWDISTDATVMKNMLAQEGLTGQDFSGNTQK